MKKLIIGFDADTKKCGLVVYDKQLNRFIYCKNQDYNTIALKFIPMLYRKYKDYYIECFIELPSLRTAVNLSSKTSHYDTVQEAFKAGRCSEIANQFKDLCTKFNFSVQTVKSEKRVRLDKSKYDNYSIEDIKRESLKLKRDGRYFSKLSYNKSIQLFDFSIINSEVVDAALLVLPYTTL
jgi:hypothetical protein